MLGRAAGESSGLWAMTQRGAGMLEKQLKSETALKCQEVGTAL